MSGLLNDVRHGWRVLRRNPSFTVVAVLTLALGLGANTAIFSLIYSVVLRPLPYPEPDRLANVSLTITGKKGPQRLAWSYPKFDEFRRMSRSFESLAAYTPIDVNLTGERDPERVSGEFVSATYFPMLGISPARGRVFQAQDDEVPGRNPVVVISDSLWRRRFGGDGSVVGRTIHVNQIAVTVIGILPPHVKGESSKAEIWAPMMMAPVLTQNPRRLQNPNSYWHRAAGRLRPGVMLEQANAEAAGIVRRMEQANPSKGGAQAWGAGVQSLADTKVDAGIRKSLLILFGAIGFVLLIACANLASLTLGRAISRRKEVAVRLSLGATRFSLVRQFLVESLLLSLLGGAAGLLFAAWGLELLRFLQPEAVGRTFSNYVRAVDAEALSIQGPVLIFNLLLSLVTGVALGLWPAFHVSRSQTAQTLKGEYAQPRRAGRRFNTRGMLAAAQLALALVLLAGAGLMIRSFSRLLATDLGVRTDHLLTFRLELPPQKYPPAATRTFLRDLQARLAALPGVEAAALTDALPVRGQSSITVVTVDDDKETKVSGVHAVSPDFFRAMGVPLLRGRLLTAQDNERSHHVALINQGAARRLFGNDNPLGHRLSVSIEPLQNGEDRPEIVGVVGDVKYEGVDQPADNDVYVSFEQMVSSDYVVVRTAGDPASVAGAVRREVAALDFDLPIYGLKTMAAQVAEATSRTRFSTVLLGVFSMLALVLAAVGIYGVISYSVAARVHEIGIRMALGAARADVLRMVLADGLVLCSVGLAIGLPAALASTRVLSSLLYQVKPGDFATFAAVSGVLAGVALAASFVPAYRATKVDPLVALRYE